MKITRRQLKKIISENLSNYLEVGKGLYGDTPEEVIATRFMLDQQLKNSGEGKYYSGFLTAMNRAVKGDLKEEEVEADFKNLQNDFRKEFVDAVTQKVDELAIDPENMSSREDHELRDFMTSELSALSDEYKKKLDKNIKASKAAKIKKSLPDVDVPYVITNFMVMTGNYDTDAKINTVFHSESGEELKFAASDLPVVFKDIEIYDFDDKHPRDKSPFIAGYVDPSKPQEFYLPRYR